LKKIENKRVYLESLLDRLEKKNGQQALILVGTIGGNDKCGYIFFLHDASISTACSTTIILDGCVKTLLCRPVCFCLCRLHGKRGHAQAGASAL